MNKKQLNEGAYSLIGIDGNAFAVMGYVSKCMRKNGYDDATINAYLEDAKSSDYNHLLGCSISMIEQLNTENGYPRWKQMEKKLDTEFESAQYQKYKTLSESLDDYTYSTQRIINKALSNVIIELWDSGEEFSKEKIKEILLDCVENFDYDSLSISSLMDDVIDY